MSDGHELEERERVLETVSESIRVLVHDTNNHLAKIQGQAQLMAMKLGMADVDPALAEGFTRHTEQIVAAVAECNALFARYRAFYRPPNSACSLIAVGALIDDAVQRVQHEHEDSTIAWDGEHADTEVFANAKTTTLAVEEALRNALQATGVRGPAHVRIVPGDTAVGIEIRDDGVGIADATMERAFEPYYSAWEGRRLAGIGLNIVERAIEAQCGTVALESDGPGEGASCTITLRAKIPT